MQWFRSRLIFRVFFTTFLPTLLLVLAFFPVYQSSKLASVANQQVAGSYAVIADANQLMQLVVAAQTGVRGYLLTADESFLDPYHQSASALKALQQKLMTGQLLTAPQVQLLQQIDAGFSDWRVSVAQVQIELRRVGNQPTDVTADRKSVV